MVIWKLAQENDAKDSHDVRCRKVHEETIVREAMCIWVGEEKHRLKQPRAHRVHSMTNFGLECYTATANFVSLITIYRYQWTKVSCFDKQINSIKGSTAFYLAIDCFV